MTFYRQQYRAPDFLCQKIELEINLDKKSTLVRNRMYFYPNPNCTQMAEEIILNGEDISLEAVKVNGKIIKSFSLQNNELRIKSTSKLFFDPFQIEILSRCHPEQNSSLKGLFVSNNLMVTQCEAEGFRKITFSIDRPDIMSVFTVKLIALKRDYPILLSNGNLIEEENLANKMHSATWHDPFPKPSYLFALVAGKLACNEKEIICSNGEKKLLQVWADKGNIKKTTFCLDTLENAIRWDESRFGLKLDLDRFMIVAVDDFNMGAMENKGLNIFNSSAIYTDQNLSLDQDYLYTERIVGHEYFHNWTGNRVTCRDWFQLTLKEGLTVFRDQEFSSDRLSKQSGKDVRRINFVNSLRSSQFSEDASPMAHPIRPDSYEAIDNFYTSTVYSKGAEVVRMIHTILGEDKFKRGMDLYFKRHDGCAVTCDDFVGAMQDASQIDLSQFLFWYSTPGTPFLTIQENFDSKKNIYSLTLIQSNKLNHVSKKPNLHIPVKIKFISPNLKRPVFQNGISFNKEYVLNITKKKTKIEFQQINLKPILSINRGFSAPIIIDYEQTQEDLLEQLACEDDTFNTWDIIQRIYCLIILNQQKFGEKFLTILKKILLREDLDAGFRSILFNLPTESFLAQKFDEYDPEALLKNIHYYKKQLAQLFELEWLKLFDAMNDDKKYNLTPDQINRRALKNKCLDMLLWCDIDQYEHLAIKQYFSADNMNDKWFALCPLVLKSSKNFEEVLDDFYHQYKNIDMLIDKWFSVQATQLPKGPDYIDKIKKLQAHPDFNIKNPNRANSLVSSFSFNNTFAFHNLDGSGYQFWAKNVLIIDKINPQGSSFLAKRGLDSGHWDKLHMQCFFNHTDELFKNKKISKNLQEIVRLIQNMKEKNLLKPKKYVIIEEYER